MASKNGIRTAAVFACVSIFTLSTPRLGADTPTVPGVMAFTATVGDNWDLFAWYGGTRSELVRLTETPYDEKSPALSANRRMLAYATSGGEFAVRDLDTEDTETLELGDYSGHWAFPAYAPDGEHLACTYFEGDAHDRARLAVIDLETKQVRFPLDQYGPQIAPAWAPKGHRIVYGYGQCSDACGGIIQEPWIVNLASGAARQALMTGSNAADFAWDPAGSRLAFSSDQSGNFDIWIYELETGRLTQVTDSPAFDGSPTFGPEGRRLAFISNRSGKSKIWIMDLASKSLRLFDPLGAEHEAAYRDVEWK